MIVHENISDASFSVVDLSGETIKSSKIVLPITSYSESTNLTIQHVFKLKKWDAAGRYVLAEHFYGNNSEWIVIDTQSVAQSKNISALFDIAISDISFSGTSGNVFYALNAGDIRKVNLSDGTISKPLVGNVTSFSVYPDNNVISFIGVSATDSSKRVVGLYRDGDSKPHVIRTVTSKGDLRVVSAHYFNEDYVAILDGDRMDILHGSYPNTTSEDTTSLKIFVSFNISGVSQLSFSPAGQYLLARTGTDFVSYDLEYQKKYKSDISGISSEFDLGWLNDNYIWSNRDGKLSIREFDGVNVHEINSVLIGQDAAITHNSRYLYSFVKTDSVYNLQRVRLTLP
jgi:hypothetical protein